MPSTCQFCKEDGRDVLADTAILVDGQPIPLCDDCADHTYITVPVDWALTTEGNQ